MLAAKLKLIIIVVALAGVTATHIHAYRKGHEQAVHEAQEKIIELNKRHAAEYQQKVDDLRELEAKWLQQKEKIVYRTKIKREEVIKYVQTNPDRECLNTDALELFNSVRRDGVPGSPATTGSTDATPAPIVTRIKTGNGGSDTAEQR